ncbi:atrophin-1 isoform X1 [Gadus chalcogrammus]|uniref:atrophin-1 isoform X1 n=2 Tax=Gadus chalcogrammus TaxID=1042646 RepID=UPI0024C4B2FD|nr:atrophin-1 isoform X1 [Gadus chalcogrammus]
MDDENMTSPNLQEMILEYAWTHKMKDLQEVVDTSLWMEAKQQYYSLKEPWRLRVATAQAYSIIKNRDVGRYERVISFLEASYRLLPTLVVAIKHMKIMFGLKTLVIMWMLKQGQGIVPIVVKILQFFPSKLPQYQDHCSNNEIFLMQKNHLDFRLFAQSLALDQMKLEDYIKNELEEQYGEHYTQKVEDRLLHYVHELEMMLPRDTYIDQILRQEHKVSHEHKEILEIIAQGSTAIASSLRMLLQWGDKSCCPLKFSSKPAVAAVVEPVALPEPAVNNISFGAPPRSETAKAPVMAREDALCRHLSQDSPLLFPMEQQENSGGVGDGEVGCPQPKEGLAREARDREAVMKADGGRDKRGPALPTDQQAEEGGPQRGEEAEGGDHADVQLSQRSDDSERVSSSSSSSSSLPHFCTKHKRWVRSILSECSKERQAQRDVPPSPLLFPSSSSSSSQDLTPSDLIPCDLIQKPPNRQTSCLSPATAQGPGLTLSMHNPCPTRSVQPLCPPGVRPGSPRAGATNTSHHVAPSTTPCTPVPECSASHEAAASSPPKPEAPSYSSGVKHRLTVGLLPDGAQSQFAPSISPDAVKPQLAPAVALPLSEQYQPALASTLPAHYQQTVSGSDSPSARSLTPGHTAAPSPGPSRCVAAPERGCHLSGSPTQTPASLHHAPPGSSKDSSEVSALPPSSDLHSVSLTSTCAARATPCTELPPGSRPALAAAVSTVSDGPPPSVSVQVPRAPTQSLPQPYVRLTRLHPLRYLREKGGSAPPSTETPLVEKQALGDPHDEGGGEEEEEEEEEKEEEEGEGGVKFLYFDPNLLYSGDESSCSDSGASEDLDYMPSRSHKKKQVPNMSPDM